MSIVSAVPWLASSGFRLTEITAGEIVLLTAGGLLTIVALVVFVYVIWRTRGKH